MVSKLDTRAFAEPRRDRRPDSLLLRGCRAVMHQMSSGRILAGYRVEVARIQAQKQHCQLDDDRLAEAVQTLRLPVRRLLVGASVDRQPLHRALALLSEAARRALGMEPYGVQLSAALAMIDGHFVQLAPGEGKTLTLALVASIHAWLGQPCHVVTANAYLASRDAVAMAALYRISGLEVAALEDSMSADDRRRVYRCSVVYATAQQLLADFLRDRMQLGAEPTRINWAVARLGGSSAQPVMCGVHTAIVDEADSVLVDEASTPLIISGPKPDPDLTIAVRRARTIVDALVRDRDYSLDPVFRDVRFSEVCWRAIQEARLTLPARWRHPDRFEQLLTQAVLARDYFLRDQHYVVIDDKVVIVDERTGRQMPGRSWGEGLHQAVEARAGVPLSDPTETLDRMSFQNFFCCYHRLLGASGTMQTLDREIAAVYGGTILRIPPRVPSKQRLHRYRVSPCREGKWRALVETVTDLHRQGRPVLIGLQHVEESELLLTRLVDNGVEAALLNAKHPQREAEIIATAGSPGRVTVATNMAGRGTDIKVSKAVADSGGLVVVSAEPHAAARVDWQMFGRTARQGAPGEIVPFVSAEDALLTRHVRWLLPVLRLLWRSSRLAVVLAPWVIGHCQRRAQLSAWRQRQRLNRSDRERREAMSFARR